MEKLNQDQYNEIASLCKKGKVMEAAKLHHLITGEAVKVSMAAVKEICEAENIAPQRTFKRSNVIAAAVLLVLILFIISMCSDSNEDSMPLTKAQQDSIDRIAWITSQFSAWDGSHAKTVELIKERMNDPESFEIVKVTHFDMKDSIVVITVFTGKNAFGGRVKNTAETAINMKGEITSFSLSEY